MMEENAMQVLLNVLSLEDSDLDFEIISEHLIKAGYILNITRAENETDFLSLILSKTFDIILADFKLPQFDAFEALKHSNRHCPDIPFICVSGSIGEMTAIELLKMGAVDYVIKDRLERLPFAVKRALEEAKEKISRRQIEESLRLSEEKYRTIFENVQDVFYQTDLSGIIKEISPSIKHFSDFNATDLIGKPVLEIYYNPDERNKLIQILEEKGEVRDYEIRLKTKVGEIKYASINARLILNSVGMPDHIDGSIRDITERKLAEDALRQSEERLRDILFSTSDWVWEVDEKGRYTYSSQRDIDLFDVAPNEIIGKTPLYFMEPDEAERVTSILSELALNKMPIKDFENWNIGKNGKRMCLLTNGVPILDNEGQLLGYRGLDKDITDRKLAEQELITAKERAEASDRLKTAFMNNISHEIRTPLNGILGFGQIIIDPAFSEVEKEGYYSMLNESCDRLLNTVTNIMDVSLLASGNQKIIKKDVVVCDLVQRVSEKFSISCQQKNIIISLPETPANTNLRIRTDEGLLSKIFYQLIDNAVKFNTHGTITIDCEEYPGGYKFYVKDTGIGISEDYKSRIFGNFEQEDFASTRKYEGTGIGLSIAKRTVELLGGKIGLESEKGKGTTFYFSIPIE